jgi:cytochrome d ubiquinol oxidase subunit II
MPNESLAFWCAAAALLGLIFYALLGGADFGGGVWDLLAAGPRKREQREAIAHALGPVWEANHVWLIFVIVILFTCFPAGYAVLMVGLFLPLHLALLGIMLRGAAFVFRNHVEKTLRQRRAVSARAWGTVFGVASIISPILMGISFGAATSGVLRTNLAGSIWFQGRSDFGWFSAYSATCGALALAACSYLAAVYLTAESDGLLREDFRRRAILAGTITAILAALVLVLARSEAHWFVEQLFSRSVLPVVLLGLILFVGSAITVWGGWHRLACVCAAGEIAVLIVGWGLAQRSYLIYPDVTLASAAAPASTLRFILQCLPIGFALLVPSLVLLLYVFKRHALKRHR